MAHPSRTISAASAESSPAASCREVLVAGYLRSANGLGETGRSVVRALTAAGLKVRTRAYDLDFTHVVDGMEDSDSIGGDDCPLIACMNADYLPKLVRRLGPEHVSRRRIIGVWFWETESPPAYAERAYPFVDEVWTASEFTRASFLRNSPVPVRVFPHPLDVSALADALIPEDFTWAGRFVYSFTFDYNSGLDRKNPGAVCAAFRAAFPDPGVPLPCGRVPMLVIKSVHGHHFPIEACELARTAHGRPDILILDKFLSPPERDGLARRADAVVSLHRSEGLGLTILEAMALGKPCIATGYSGNLDFMTPANSFPVRYQLKPVGSGSLHYPPNDHWAEPDTPHAAELMHRVAFDPEHALAIGARAREDVNARHPHAVAGKVLAGLLDEANTGPIREKDFSRLVSPHKQAGQVLTAVKEGIKSRRARGKTPGSTQQSSKTLKAIESDLLKLVKAQRLIRKSIKEKEAALDQRLAYLESLIQNLGKNP